jgi:hypothetical protein
LRKRGRLLDKAADRRLVDSIGRPAKPAKGKRRETMETLPGFPADGWGWDLPALSSIGTCQCSSPAADTQWWRRGSSVEEAFEKEITDDDAKD